MTIRIQRVAASVLTLSAAYVGAWALLGPRSFFEDFPVRGHDWVNLAGAYDEHLIRDVGGLYLALGVLTAWAALRPQVDALRATGIAWEVFSLPHLAFHAGHLEPFDAADKVGQWVSLGGTVLLAALLVLPPRDEVVA
jgi:hypothetical protein